MGQAALALKPLIQTSTLVKHQARLGNQVQLAKQQITNLVLTEAALKHQLNVVQVDTAVDQVALEAVTVQAQVATVNNRAT